MLIAELEETLLIISYKEENEKEAQIAFSKLYKEYGKFLYSLVKKREKDTQIVSATVSNVFLAMYDNPLSFKARKGETSDGSFKAWLSVVAKHELLKLYKEYFDEKISFNESDSDSSVFESTEVDENQLENINFKILQGALDSLNERDREIMLTLYTYYEEGKKTPSEILELLCKKYNTSKDNIRQIKVRSEAKIIDYFSKVSPLKPIKNVR